MRAALLLACLCLTACAPDKSQPRASDERVEVVRIVETGAYTLDRVTTSTGTFLVAFRQHSSSGGVSVLALPAPVEVR